MIDVFTRGFVPLRRWQGSQDSIRWATDAEVRAEFGVSLVEFVQRWREMKRDAWVMWLEAQRKAMGVKAAPQAAKPALSTYQPGGWRGHPVQQPKIGGKR